MQTAKDKLLHALVTYIKKGEDIYQISLSKIAHDAEIGKSTVYEYFESKDEMIIETYRYLIKHYQEILLKDIEAKDFKGALLEELSHILMVMKDARSLMEAIMKVPHHQQVKLDVILKDEITFIQNEMSERFNSIMHIGVKEGVIPFKKPKKETPYVVKAIITGLLFQYINQEFEMTEKNLLQLIFDEIVYVAKR